MNASPGQAALVLRDVLKRREKGGNLFELRVPSLTVMAGEFVAVVGESGCGKSTLLDMLGLVLGPTSAATFHLCLPGGGRVHDIPALPPRRLAEVRQRDLGYVLQNGGLLPFLSVRDNILLPCRINGQRGAEEHVAELARRLKIENQMAKKPAFLSGGQRQRVAIARALAHRPPVVLADEPTAAVDRLTAREIRDTFRQLTRQMGVTLLMVTHDLSLVEDSVDRVFVFDVSKPTPEHTLAVCREGSAQEGRP
ncbi:MAG: ABC transporter ATP-binding protein [Kiritimatiellia bacterium]